MKLTREQYDSLSIIYKSSKCITFEASQLFPEEEMEVIRLLAEPDGPPSEKEIGEKLLISVDLVRDIFWQLKAKIKLE